MKKIAVFGPGCMKCKKAEENVRQVLAETGVEAIVEHVTEMEAIVAAGVMSTPAVAIDGVVKLSGRVPTTAELREWIAG
jgi:small redox-active disulfide protein 2